MASWINLDGQKRREINSIHQTFIKVKEDRNYLYGKIKLLTVNFQVVSSISCYNFNLNGFREKISRNAKFLQTFFSRNFALFSYFSLRSFSRKNVKFHENVCKIRTKMFAFFQKKYRSLEFLYTSELEYFNVVKWIWEQYPRKSSLTKICLNVLSVEKL